MPHNFCDYYPLYLENKIKKRLTFCNVSVNVSLQAGFARNDRAYQTLNRVANVKAEETVLIIGTALLQPGQLAGLKKHSIASERKHAALVKCGATPIGYYTQEMGNAMLVAPGW